MAIESGKVVTIHYTLKDVDGNLLESTDGNDPLAYLHGHHNIIPGLETALTGKAEGDTVSVLVAPEEGYGPRVPELIQEVPRSAFEGVDDIAPGMAFHAGTDDGSSHRVVVTEVTAETVTVDGNHPLAGQSLNFDVKVVSVREAQEEEIAHGHVHGHGHGHDH